MSELSPEAAELLARARGGDEPDPRQEAHARESLEKLLGVTLPVASVVAAAGAAKVAASVASAKAVSGATGLGAGASLTMTLLAGAASVAVGVGGVWVVKKTVLRSQPAAPKVENVRSAAVPGLPPQPAVEVAAAGEPAIEPVPAPVPAPVISPSPTEPAPAAELKAPLPRASAPPVAAPPAAAPAKLSDPETEPVAVPAPSAPPVLIADAENEPPVDCSHASEKTFVVRASQALNAGRPASALTILDAFQRACPSGEWHVGAWSVRAEALCALGRRGEARQFIVWYGNEHPEDPDGFEVLNAACPAR